MSLGDRPGFGAALDLRAYFVTDEALCHPRSVLDVVAAAVDGGVTCVQVRHKDGSGRDFLDQVVAVAKRVGDRVSVLVNDRVDVYLAACDAGSAVAGVHIGQDDLPVHATRALIGPHAVLGLSASSDDEIRVAGELPAGIVDYLGVGAVRATPTKPDAPEAIGFDGLERAVRLTNLPVVAIGGLKANDAARVRSVGAAGMAVVSAICAAPDPRIAAEQLRAAWDAGPTTDRLTGEDEQA